MSGFLTPLRVELIHDGLWELISPLSYNSEIYGGVITADIGFRTDFASYPKIPGIYELLSGKANKEATIHDWLYSSHLVDREKADKILLEMVRLNPLISDIEGRMIYEGVRVGGQSHW
ncbi:MAG: DUF1353 domain-containing protein [Methylobacter sp.]